VGIVVQMPGQALSQGLLHPVIAGFPSGDIPCAHRDGAAQNYLLQIRFGVRLGLTIRCAGLAGGMRGMPQGE